MLYYMVLFYERKFIFVLIIFGFYLSGKLLVLKVIWSVCYLLGILWVFKF